MNFDFDEITNRIKDVSNTNNLKQVAKLIEVNYLTLKRKNPDTLKNSNLIGFCHKHNINLEWLLYGTEPKYKDQYNRDLKHNELFKKFAQCSYMLAEAQKSVSEAIHPDSQGGEEITTIERIEIEAQLVRQAMSINEILKSLNSPFAVKVIN